MCNNLTKLVFIITIIYIKRLKCIEVSNSKSLETKCLLWLQEENYLLIYHKDNKTMVLSLPWYNYQPCVGEIQAVSTKSDRIYRSLEDLPYVANGLGMYYLSTPSGVCSDKTARKHKEGGEILLVVI